MTKRSNSSQPSSPQSLLQRSKVASSPLSVKNQNRQHDENDYYTITSTKANLQNIENEHYTKIRSNAMIGSPSNNKEETKKPGSHNAILEDRMKETRQPLGTRSVSFDNVKEPISTSSSTTPAFTDISNKTKVKANGNEKDTATRTVSDMKYEFVKQTADDDDDDDDEAKDDAKVTDTLDKERQRSNRDDKRNDVVEAIKKDAQELLLETKNKANNTDDYRSNGSTNDHTCSSPDLHDTVDEKFETARDKDESPLSVSTAILESSMALDSVLSEGIISPISSSNLLDESVMTSSSSTILSTTTTDYDPSMFSSQSRLNTTSLSTLLGSPTNTEEDDSMLADRALHFGDDDDDDTQNRNNDTQDHDGSDPDCSFEQRHDRNAMLERALFEKAMAFKHGVAPCGSGEEGGHRQGSSIGLIDESSHLVNYHNNPFLADGPSRTTSTAQDEVTVSDDKDAKEDNNNKRPWILGTGFRIGQQRFLLRQHGNQNDESLAHMMSMSRHSLTYSESDRNSLTYSQSTLPDQSIRSLLSSSKEMSTAPFPVVCDDTATPRSFLSSSDSSLAGASGPFEVEVAHPDQNDGVTTAKKQVTSSDILRSRGDDVQAARESILSLRGLGITIQQSLSSLTGSLCREEQGGTGGTVMEVEFEGSGADDDDEEHGSSKQNNNRTFLNALKRPVSFSTATTELWNNQQQKGNNSEQAISSALDPPQEGQSTASLSKEKTNDGNDDDDDECHTVPGTASSNSLFTKSPPTDMANHHECYDSDTMNVVRTQQRSCSSCQTVVAKMRFTCYHYFLRFPLVARICLIVAMASFVAAIVFVVLVIQNKV